MFFLKESARQRVEKAQEQNKRAMEKNYKQSKSVKYFVNPNGCFIVYTRCPDSHGYVPMTFPQIEFTWKTESLIEQILLHRLIYKSYYGEIPNGMVVRHKCDNPSCINPLHLELGTRGDNAHDCKVRGRGKSLKNLAINQIWIDGSGGEIWERTKRAEIIWNPASIPV